MVAACLAPLAIAILLSGLDDFVVDVAFILNWLRRRPATTRPPTGEKSIAIFVPLWREAEVIAGMIEHNVAAIHYDHYRFFIGAYPNDDATLDAVRELEARFPHVHLAVCPHDGPTSKADCLNWIYQRMLLYEEHHGQRFEVIVTHDAEDLIHPEALHKINEYADEYAMIQIPVLPLPTPFPSIVHSIYCDEFAEWQLKDMPARKFMGSFVPSNGVGTGYTRAALEKLATADHNLIFEPSCLTEDYENGLRLHALGLKQVFVPLARSGTGWIATREFFPQAAWSAIRQRTRWITGIGLQSWERHGWRGRLPQLYWFWRDRKGLLGNPVSLLSNALFFYGLATWVAARAYGVPWGLASYGVHRWLLAATLFIQAVRSTVRVACATRLYGLLFGIGAPVRAIFANWINSIATLRALYAYMRSRLLGIPLVWLKTEHAYPSRSALVEHKRKLGEILTGSAYLDEAELETALESRPAGLRIGEHLVALGKITDDELYEALSLQQSLPAGRVEPWGVNVHVARALPRNVIREWRVLPFRIAAGNMFLASPEIPTDEMTRSLHGFTQLSLRFHLVTPANFEELILNLL